MSASRDTTGLEDLERRLGVGFRLRDHLLRAVTHGSYRHERGEGEDYERLEFLGDSVLGFVVAEWLSKDDPSAGEGELTRRKQTVVCAEALADAARELDLGAFLRLGRGEEQSGGRLKPSLLADAFEAIVGAVYLDRGLRAARALVRRRLGARLRATRDMSLSESDFKTRFQELAQARWRLTPRYRIASTLGPPHARSFDAEVTLDGRIVGTGRGPSRKQAEQEAARAALAGTAEDLGGTL
jgi:ribonuclease-3